MVQGLIADAMTPDQNSLVLPTGGRNLDWMICLGRRGLTDARFALVAALGLALPFALSDPAPAQEMPARGRSLDALRQHDQQLEELREQQNRSAEKEAAIRREIERLGADRRKLNQDLIDTAARLRDLEAKVAATEQRLNPLDAKEAGIRHSLDSRRAVIGQVLAALQRMGRSPPPALITSPEDALQSVRSAMILGAILPEMQDEVRALASDLTELFNVRRQIATERDRLKAEVATLGDERARMAALIEERQKQEMERRGALEAERQRAAELAQKADNLKDLIANLEKGLDRATREAREASRRGSQPALAALHDPGRLAPAVDFASLRGHVPIPVNGVKLREFGAPDGLGGAERGVSIATRAGAQVTAPADGWVVYAGPFRSYGQLLILNAGGGYHILLAGMERISVDLGQFVLAGEPVAVMGDSSQIAAILATGSSQPVLYVEFRKDGNPVDPGPWWAAGEGEKVRG